MRGFDSKFIEELKNKNDIVDVVSRYVRLENKGGNFWGVCPFHHEKTPSFSVNPRGQFFYCFGCHKSGDVITFVSEMESLDFADAVKLLAEKANMKLQTDLNKYPTKVIMLMFSSSNTLLVKRKEFRQ